MQDRFKFRIWDKFCETWLTDFAINQDGEINKFFNSEEALKRRFVLMQCTGLKDRNGKLIFEGDIIKYLSGTVNKKFVKYITKWNDNMGQFYISKINPSEYDNWKDWHLGRHDLDYEVIGNIYENEDLLNGNR